MDNGAVFRIFGLFVPGHSCYWRLHGERGAMETERGPGYYGPGRVRLWHEGWDLREGEMKDALYEPTWHAHRQAAQATGHGGGDFWVEHYFAEAIRTGQQPFLDVYRGVAMSSVGILAWRSALENGVPVEVPDFSDEASRKKYENDHLCPFTTVKNARLIPNHIGPKRDVSKDEKVVENSRAAWKELGYTDQEIDELLQP